MLKYQKTGDSVMVIWLRFSYKKIEKTAEPDWSRQSFQHDTNLIISPK